MEAKEQNNISNMFCSRVPRPEDFREAYKSVPETEKRDLYEGADGFYYSVKSSKLFVPQELREAMLFWFHTSRYGGHSGVNRTLRRMKQFVWWSGMHKDVTKYISNCLPCKRHRPQTQQKTFSGVLTKPQPLQMISLDFVGPRVWGSKKVYFIVGIDHASRFAMAKVCPGPTTNEAISFLTSNWMSVFQAPEAILVDRGASFISTEFRSFITNEIGAYVVYTSPYYPQGNAINESCHRAIEMSIKVLENDLSITFEQALADAITVHNSTPHPATGESPFCCMFGMEPAFPGWQTYMWKEGDNVRRSKLKEIRFRGLIRAKITEELQLKDTENIKVAVGDWIVYLRSEYERNKAKEDSESGTAANKYSAIWSLPAKVTKVNNKVVHVTELGRSVEPRQVPLTQIKILQGPVPPTLAKLNIAHIQKENPRFVKARVIFEALNKQPSSWEEIIQRATQGLGKRQRSE